MDKDLEKMIDEAVEKESQLQVMGESLALQNKQFAEYLEAKRIADKELEVLWDIVKEEMIKEGLTEHENDYIKLKLSPSGKYKTDDIDQIDDALCDIKKVLNNKKISAFLEVNGRLPDGIESTGFILRKTLK